MNEERLSRYLQQVIFDMLMIVSVADASRAGADTKLIREIENILDQFGRTIEEVLPEQIILDYFGGVDEVNKLLAGGAAVAGGKAVQNGMIQPAYQRLIHLEAVEEIVNDAMDDVARAIATTRGSAVSAVMATVDEVREELAAGLIRGDTRQVTTNRLMKRFLDQGLTAFVVEDKNGRIRQLPLNFYTETVVRSKTRQANVTGSVNRYKERGVGLVRIVGNGDQCAQCAVYRNMVVSLDGSSDQYPSAGNIPLPPYHPRCRCGIQPFIEERKTPEEIQEAQEHNAGYAPGKDRRTPAQKAAYEKEQRMRRQANEEVKQFLRWQSALGAEAPKTLGAFRNMKRQNTTRFQELQTEYRSFAQLNRKK